MSDATTALLRALRVCFPSHQVTATQLRSHCWASATFVGVQHDVAILVEGEGAREAAEAFALDAAEREFPMPGHFVADMEVDYETPAESSARLAIKALTVEEE